MRKILLASIATLGAGLAFTNAAHAQPVKPVAPGAIVVHLNGYLQFGIDDYGSTYNTYLGDKLNAVSTNGDARFYIGVDAKTLSGIAYGAQLELRDTKSDAGQSAGSTTGTGSTAGTETIYVKRAYGYIGTDEGGYVRFGQGDSAFTLLQVGSIEAFGDNAQFNSDGGTSLVLPTAAAPSTFVYADASALYATDKVVYVSPVIAGFSGSFGYEPNSNGLKEGYGSDAEAVATSAALSSATTFAGAKDRKNTVDAALLYVLKADGAVTKANIGFIHGSPIAYDGTTALPAADKLDSLNVFEAGAQSTFAGVTLGAGVKWGQVLDGYAFKPVGTRDGFDYIVGGNYVLGPYVVGASFFDGESAGAYYPGDTVTIGTKKYGVGKSLSEYGAALGGNYVVGKDLSLYIQYLYGHKQQYLAFAGNKSDTQVQALGAGATLKW
jgi:hypothetical protein